MRKIIGILYRTLLKPILFCFPPEAMHTFFGRVGYLLGKLWITRKMTQAIFSYAHPSLMQTCRGMTFANPVGLAAGFDKDIQLPQIIDAVGFGRTEVGSITYQPYAGNTGKRLIRLLTSQGLLVNYGLKNNGAVWAKQRLLHTSCRVPLFVSIAKTNCVATCDLQKGIADYQGTGELLGTLDQVNGFVLNISCPNAFGGEDYTTPERLTLLLRAMQSGPIEKKPILVKLPVDKEVAEIVALVEVCIAYGVAGVIISNLTKKREYIFEQQEISGTLGGISGKPTQAKSDFLIGEVYKQFGKQIVIIGVGGIFCAEDAYHKIRQGATLVQLITGMIFQGPQLIGEMNAGLVDLLRKDGFAHVQQAIGANHHQEYM